MKPARPTATPDRRTDEELMRRVAERRQDHFQSLYTRYAPLVYHLAAQTLDAAAAEEIVQDVFLTVWRKADLFDPQRGAFRPWLLQIAHFRIINELRRRSRRPQLDPDAAGDLSEDLPDDSAEPIESAWHDYRREAIQAAVDHLPPPQQTALRLAFFEELTHEQVADMLNVPLGTVKTRIRAGLLKLRANLAPLGIVLALIGLVAILGIRYQSELAASERQASALMMVTLSDSTAIHVPPVSGLDPQTHASYRSRPNTGLVVVALHNFAPAPEGRTYQGWVLHQGAWISLGTALPDAAGNAVLIAENPGLASAPEKIQVTVEPLGGSQQPTGRIILLWSNP